MTREEALERALNALRYRAQATREMLEEPSMFGAVDELLRESVEDDEEAVVMLSSEAAATEERSAK